MRLTRAIEKIIENAGLAVTDTGSGYVLRCASQPVSFFAADPLRVLALFSIAASLGATVEWNTFEAAGKAAPQVCTLAPEKIYAAVDGILLSEHPEVLASLITAGGLAAFGFSAPSPCLHTLSRISAARVARWWAFLHLYGVSAQEIAKRLSLPDYLVADLVMFDKAFAFHAPKNEYEVKKLLSRIPTLDFYTAAEIFCVFDRAWRGTAALYAGVLASRAPYSMAQLAVTAAELSAEGVRKSKINFVMEQLLDTVLKEPKLNTYPVLVALAKTVSRL